MKPLIKNYTIILTEAMQTCALKMLVHWMHNRWTYLSFSSIIFTALFLPIPPPRPQCIHVVLFIFAKECPSGVIFQREINHEGQKIHTETSKHVKKM